jgi:uncharacterized protein YegL
MFTRTPVQQAITSFTSGTPGSQNQQGGGPIIAGVPDSNRRMKSYGDQLIIFVGDNSGSMSGGKGHEASQAFSVCQKELAEEANKDGFRVSVIIYGSSAHVAHSAKEPLAAAVSLDGDGGCTRLAPALSLAQAEITQYGGRPDRKLQPPVVIIFSDGQLDDGHQAEIEADRLKQMGAKIISIGFGSDADEKQLIRLATAPDHYAYADVGQLKPLFAMVGKTLSQQSRLRRPPPDTLEWPLPRCT